MCYQYSVPGDKVLTKRFDVNFEADVSFSRIYHVSSFSIPRLPVITNKEPKKIQFFYWGLIPFWVKSIKDSEEIRVKTMNARAETLFSKPSFRHAIHSNRCLIPADGFYEWRFVDGKNYPYYIHLKNNETFAFAGIWDSWKNPESSEKIQTYSIITTDANALIVKIHNKKKRMPVILRKENEKDWIKSDLTQDEIENFLTKYDENEMEAYTISKFITSRAVDKNTPEVMKPFEYPYLEKIIRK